MQAGYRLVGDLGVHVFAESVAFAEAGCRVFYQVERAEGAERDQEFFDLEKVKNFEKW